MATTEYGVVEKADEGFNIFDTVTHNKNKSAIKSLMYNENCFFKTHLTAVQIEKKKKNT